MSQHHVGKFRNAYLNCALDPKVTIETAPRKYILERGGGLVDQSTEDAASSMSMCCKGFDGTHE